MLSYCVVKFLFNKENINPWFFFLFLYGPQASHMGSKAQFRHCASAMPN